MRRFHSSRGLALAVAAMAVLGVAGPLPAGDSVSFSAELSAVFVGQDREGALFALEGSATHMGPVTGLARNEARGPRELGVFFLEAANGDTLVFAYELQRLPGRAEGIYVVIGGTGRFEGATGGGVATVDASQGDFIIVTVEGTLSF